MVSPSAGGAIALAALLTAAACDAPPTDYERELARLDARIAGLEAGDAATAERPCSVRTELTAAYWRRAMMTGEARDRERARGAAESTPDCGCPSCVQREILRIRLDLHEHRVLSAVAALARLEPALSASTADELRAEIEAQCGNVAAARARLERATRSRGDWASLLSLAVLEQDHGRGERAEELYTAAQSLMTAKEMRAFAWAELQRGRLDDRSGRAADALRHFRRADRAYSGYWLTHRLLAGLPVPGDALPR
ncbi:MAG TPA: hypothetical protein VKU85_16475 [bacterium]|nr:hypothetical protein [bacterium]